MLRRLQDGGEVARVVLAAAVMGTTAFGVWRVVEPWVEPEGVLARLLSLGLALTLTLGLAGAAYLAVLAGLRDGRVQALRGRVDRRRS